MNEIIRLFPESIAKLIENNMKNRWTSIQEIRLRLSQPIEFVFNDSVEWLEKIITHNEYKFIINQLSDYSLYRMENELREGYITIEGGHRVGLAGKVNTRNGEVKAIQHITFMNIRIAKERIGAALPLIPYVYDKRYLNTLLIGPPQTGKTTLIRDLTRIIATGWQYVPARKVAVIDERSEIGASIQGIPQHNLGIRTDVMDACPKAEGMMMAIRSMSPELLVVDEIGSNEDVHALMEAINAGVTIICTIHGRTLSELKKRPSLFPIFSQKVFQRYIFLDSDKSPGKINRIYDEHEIEIVQKKRWIQHEVDRSISIDRNHHMDRFRME